MGYDPRKYYTGRSPLEALSIGVDMKESDVVYRCNLVTLTEEDVPYEEQRILDHSSGEISTEDAAILLRDVCQELKNENCSLCGNQLSSLSCVGKWKKSGAYTAS